MSNTPNRKYTIKQYTIEFGGAMLTYILVLMIVVYTRPSGTSHIGQARFIELLPTLPLLFAFWAIIRQYHRMDEFYQRLHSEAFALGAIIWGLCLMLWGFAENAGAPPINTIFIAPGLIALWGICLPIILQRYK